MAPTKKMELLRWSLRHDANLRRFELTQAALGFTAVIYTQDRVASAHCMAEGGLSQVFLLDPTGRDIAMASSDEAGDARTWMTREDQLVLFSHAEKPARQSAPRSLPSSLSTILKTALQTKKLWPLLELGIARRARFLAGLANTPLMDGILIFSDEDEQQYAIDFRQMRTMVEGEHLSAKLWLPMRYDSVCGEFEYLAGWEAPYAKPEEAASWYRFPFRSYGRISKILVARWHESQTIDATLPEVRLSNTGGDYPDREPKLILVQGGGDESFAANSSGRHHLHLVKSQAPDAHSQRPQGRARRAP